MEMSETIQGQQNIEKKHGVKCKSDVLIPYYSRALALERMKKVFMLFIFILSSLLILRKYFLSLHGIRCIVI